jgi:hypothetical protein
VTKNSKKFRQKIHGGSRSFRRNPKKYYKDFEKAFMDVFEEFYTKKFNEDESERLVNLLDKFGDCKQKLNKLKSKWNEDGKFSENCEHVLRKVFPPKIEYTERNKSKMAFTMQRSFYVIFRKYNTLCADKTTPLSVVLIDYLNTLDTCMPKIFPGDKSIEEKFKYFFSVTEDRWNENKDYDWIRKLKGILDKEFKSLTQGHNYILNLIINNERIGTFSNSIFMYCKKMKQDSLLADLCIQYPCLTYVLETPTNKLDRKCEDYISARNVYKYGLMYSFLRYKEKSTEKKKWENDWMKSIIQNIIEIFDHKFGEESNINVVFYSIGI